MYLVIFNLLFIEKWKSIITWGRKSMEKNTDAQLTINWFFYFIYFFFFFFDAWKKSNFFLDNWQVGI